ncbi:MAG TPA: hypothetical protein VHE78_09645 [Gemmatimonadaceae bacterium]|nr:hypothetical protein [Gemmatimonadaceae bacterium]
MAIHPRVLVLYLLLVLQLAGWRSARAQSPLWAGLHSGQHGVGFQIIDTVDATRTFPAASGKAGPRPMRLYVWYPASGRTGRVLTIADLVPESWANPGVMVPAEPRAFAQALMRARSGPAFATMSDSAANALLATPLAARLGAAPTAGRWPVILLAPGQPLAMPVAAEYLASNGMLVIGVARKGGQTYESVNFTPNPEAIDTDADDLAFALGVARGRRDARAEQLGLVAYSSAGLSTLAFALRSHAAAAIAVFEGWEGWEVGQASVKSLRDNDPRGFRSSYLLIEKTDEESAPALRKTSAFFDTMAYAPRWRVAFDSATHTDFASTGVALPAASATLRRNFVAAHELLRDFFAAHLGATPLTQARWSPAPRGPWEHVSTYQQRDPVPTSEEFFHLAETNPRAADSLARSLNALAPAVVPFSEASLLRLGLLATQRRPADAAVIYGIVARAFPGSAAAATGVSDALSAAGRRDEARTAARRALDLLSNDASMSAGQKASARLRLTARLEP